MKKYYTQRPTVYVMVKWDGTNITEFEDAATDTWNNEFAEFTFNDNAGTLEVWRDTPWSSPMLAATLETDEWFDGSSVMDGNLNAAMSEVSGSAPWHYVVDEDA